MVNNMWPFCVSGFGCFHKNPKFNFYTLKDLTNLYGNFWRNQKINSDNHQQHQICNFYEGVLVF